MRKVDPRMVTIGVLALQGDFAEHAAALDRLGVHAREVRVSADLESIDALIVPGGESTTIARLLRSCSLYEPVVSMARDGLPTWGTCAGLIVMAHVIVDDPLEGMDLIDVDVRRNAYGRQVDSFEVEVPVPALGGPAFPAVFIRAPVIERVGPKVEVLASLSDGAPIAVRQGNLLGSTFHPELTNDLRFHALLVSLARERSQVTDAAAV